MVITNSTLKEEEKAKPDDIIAGVMRITGVKVTYYFICHTKLWLFSHNITLEKEHDNVNIGKQLHEDRYKRDSKEITIDQTISIDFIRKGNTIVLHEIKKTKSMEDAHRWQMLYYLYYLKSKGIQASGEINYPLVSKKEEIVLLEKDESDMENMINNIRKIVMGRMPPPKKIRICPKCAYYEFCFGDEA
ncbi:MAG: CRISPR-associated protein Cas4 [Candidatus Methanoperedenaceae archaeon]|nr:MAG: CRISPR-associated protein Cas4 [Candidatus Methanoperedenaceae archaeon]